MYLMYVELTILTIFSPCKNIQHFRKTIKTSLFILFPNPFWNILIMPIAWAIIILKWNQLTCDFWLNLHTTCCCSYYYGSVCLYSPRIVPIDPIHNAWTHSQKCIISQHPLRPQINQFRTLLLKQYATRSLSLSRSLGVRVYNANNPATLHVTPCPIYVYTYHSPRLFRQ